MNNYKGLEKIFKGLANCRRIEIIELLKNKPGLSIIEISEKTRSDLKNISQHVQKMEAAGLIVKKSDGNFVRMKLTNRAKSILEFYRILE